MTVMWGYSREGRDNRVRAEKEERKQCIRILRLEKHLSELAENCHFQVKLGQSHVCLSKKNSEERLRVRSKLKISRL